MRNPRAFGILKLSRQMWACGAVGSALPWHGRGQGFESLQVHQIPQTLSAHWLASWPTLESIWSLNLDATRFGGSPRRPGCEGVCAWVSSVHRVLSSCGLPLTACLWHRNNEISKMRIAARFWIALAFLASAQQKSSESGKAKPSNAKASASFKVFSDSTPAARSFLCSAAANASSGETCR